MRTKLVMVAVIVALAVSAAGAAALEALAAGPSGAKDGLVIWKQECPAHLGRVEVVDMGTSLLVMCLADD